MWKEAMSYVEKLTAHGICVNQASLCSEYSTLMFARSSYDEVSNNNNQNYCNDINDNENKTLFNVTNCCYFTLYKYKGNFLTLLNVTVSSIYW